MAKVKITKVIDERNIPAQVAKFLINETTKTQDNNSEIILDTLKAKHGENVVTAARVLIQEPLKKELDEYAKEAAAIQKAALDAVRTLETRLDNLHKMSTEIVNGYKRRFNVN